ncbi:MAG: tRNA (adenosine(37)-N6)-dimethylallyltransferase MiaA [Gemmatimonadota bacterium]|nr:tRNA (adenosine(37)-N6)-dimethylallyltransferase MiaA [Gemmatimonadota bacterium]
MSSTAASADPDVERGRTPPLAIVGPTASGKTAVAIEVARELDGEIVSADSRQAYRGFQVGTAAPTERELVAAPHHGVAFLDPDERYGAGRFVELWDHARAGIEARGRVPILAGGTGLFLRALTHPMFREPEMAPEWRERLRGWLDGIAAADLGRWAARLDPGLADDRTPSAATDPQRAHRTVELALASGRPLSWWIEHGTPARPPFDGPVFALDLPGEALRARIRERARAMLDGGAWEAETRRLEAEGLSGSRAFDAIGYREVLGLTRGEIEREEALERIFAATWAYARRQRTWFRHQLPPDAVRLDASSATGHLSRRIADVWRARARGKNGPSEGAAGVTRDSPGRGDA